MRHVIIVAFPALVVAAVLYALAVYYTTSCAGRMTWVASVGAYIAADVGARPACLRVSRQ